MAGFETIYRRVTPQQVITVVLTNIIETIFFFRIPAVVFREIGNQCHAQQRNVPGRCVMVLVRQAGGIYKIAVCHAHLLRVMIHQSGKSIFRTRQVFGQRDTGIITGLDHHTLD